MDIQRKKQEYTLWDTFSHNHSLPADGCPRHGRTSYRGMGQDGSTITEHLRGAPVHVINAADNALIEEGDDFGFSGTIS